MLINLVDDHFPHEARVIIHPGKNCDGYWNIEQLVKQVIIGKTIVPDTPDTTFLIHLQGSHPKIKDLRIPLIIRNMIGLSRSIDPQS